MKRFQELLWAKILAFVLVLVLGAVTVIGLGAIFLGADMGIVGSGQDWAMQPYQHIAYKDARQVLKAYLTEGEEAAQVYKAEGNAQYLIRKLVDQGNRVDEEGRPLPEQKSEVLFITYDGEKTPYSDVFYFQDKEFDIVRESATGLELPAIQYEVEVYLKSGLPAADAYQRMSQAIQILDVKYFDILITTGLCALFALALFGYLLWAAGHKRGVEGICAGPIARKFPLELLLALVGGAAFLLIALAMEALYNARALELFVYGESVAREEILLGVGIPLICGLLAAAFLLLAAIDLAQRFKFGAWWRNTLVYLFLRTVGRFLKKYIGGALSRCFGLGGDALKKIPQVGLVVLGCVVFAILTLLMIVPSSGVVRLTLWLVIVPVVLVGIYGFALMLRRLQNAARTLADGNLGHKVETQNLVWIFKRSGEDLNRISFGMHKAVEESLKSERFRTELITNVSHDIKTPLTSIINYADLIGKEESSSEKLREYSAVLLRQSERLKKLLEDLLEASKASTGNLDVNLAPCELGVLFEQTAGEYEEKLAAKNLQLLRRQPEQSLRILADGRLLWRVFDNLMSNVCKYALAGTRVYLNLEEVGKEVLISFKNISAHELNVTAEELLERFSRGDESRSSEGSGLGLSIAQSLTQLQGGSFALETDGDLFKVSLRFARVEP